MGALVDGFKQVDDVAGMLLIATSGLAFHFVVDEAKKDFCDSDKPERQFCQLACPDHNPAPPRLNAEVIEKLWAEYHAKRLSMVTKLKSDLESAQSELNDTKSRLMSSLTQSHTDMTEDMRRTAKAFSDICHLPASCPLMVQVKQKCKAISGTCQSENSRPRC